MNKQVQFYRHISFSAFILIGMMACGPSSQSDSDRPTESDPRLVEIQALEKAVIDVHDEVMPKMATLNNMRVKLLKQYKDENLGADQRVALSSAITHLENADSLMWGWMHNYSRPDYDGNLDSAKAYLENEKVKVEYMKGKFLSSMAEGEALLIKNDQK
jgi:hypothetical protein